MKTGFESASRIELKVLLAFIVLMITLSFDSWSQFVYPNLLCYGDPVNLYCGALYGCGVPGATYTWTNSNDPLWISNDENPVIPQSSSPVYATGTFFLSIDFVPPPGGHSSGSVFVVVPPEIIITGTIVPVSCSGNDGCITIQVSGGTPPYYYVWSNGATTRDICGLGCGTYTVTVYDANNCQGTRSWDVTTDMALSATVHRSSCAPVNDARIDLTVSNGCSPFTYQWSNLAMTEDVSSLTCGTYTVTVTDAIGCHKTASWTYDDLILSTAVIDANPSCCDGAIDLTVSCGTPPYTFQWISVPPGFSAYSEDIFGLCPGWYCVTVLDANTLSKTCCFQVMQNKSTCQSNYLRDITVQGGANECFDAVNTIQVAGNGTTFVVQNGGFATMIAGGKIIYQPGTKVYLGGKMDGSITTTGQYCNKNNIGGEENVDGIDDYDVTNRNLTENQLFRIYPNPTSGNFILELYKDENFSEVRVEIYTIQGETVLAAELKGENRHEFSLSGKPAGLYFIRVVTGDHSSTGKIIKQ